jgi:hypothetical protein
VNKTLNTLRNWTGDKFPGAAQGVLTETLVDYAKVVSGQNTPSGVTKYAAQLAEGLLPLSDNPAQFYKKLDEYRGMMQARIDATKRIGSIFSKVAAMEKSSGPEIRAWPHSTPPKKGMKLQGGYTVEEIYYNPDKKQYRVQLTQ